MIRRVSTVLIACLLAAMTSATPAFAGNGNGGGGSVQVHTDGDLHCC